MQRGCDSHRRKLLQITRLDGAIQTWMDNILQNSESTVPPATMQDGHDPYLSDSEDEDDSAPRIKDPTTGARIRVQDATGIILRFSANVSTSQEGSRHSSALFRFETIPESRKTHLHCYTSSRASGSAGVWATLNVQGVRPENGLLSNVQ